MKEQRRRQCWNRGWVYFILDIASVLNLLKEFSIKTPLQILQILTLVCAFLCIVWYKPSLKGFSVILRLKCLLGVCISPRPNITTTIKLCISKVVKQPLGYRYLKSFEASAAKRRLTNYLTWQTLSMSTNFPLLFQLWHSECDTGYINSFFLSDFIIPWLKAVV